MKKAIYLKSIFLLCLLLAGVVSAHADGYDYDCVKVTSLDDVAGGETVLLVDQSKNLALSPLNGPYGIGLKGVDVAIGEDNVIRNVSADMIWTIGSKSGNSFTFNNNDKPLYGSLSSSSVSVTNEPYGQCTNEFFLDEYGEYGENGGKLYYVGNNDIRAYFSWSTSDDKTITIDSETQARFTLYKVTIKNYVKWKLVDGTNVTASKNDVVAIVDTNTGRAMSNDKGDKAPDAVAVTLNYDKDRLLGEVPENVQWSLSWGTHRWFGLAATDPATDEATDDNLYADSDGLKVGTNEPSLFMPTTIGGVKYMQVTVDQKDYLAGVEASMFSNTWILKELKDNKPDDKVKDTRFAMFKKIDDPQRIVTIELPEYYNYDLKNKDQYTLYERDFNEKVTITGAEKSEINWTSSNPDVAEINPQGVITLKDIRGTTVITAYVEEDTENHYYDKASAKCTVIVDDGATEERGSMHNPLTVEEAKELAETGELKRGGNLILTLKEGVNYYVKGKVSKVNSGMMAMFGDMDFGEMMGGSGSEDSMDDMDFDPEDMEESGFDMSSFDMSSFGFDMSAMFGTSDKVTYYISDDGTKDGQMKVINGCGTLSDESTGGTMVFNPIPKLSPGDCVVVCGPLVYTKDESMFSGMMGGNSSDEEKKSGKVDEMNYLAVYDPTLLITEPEPKEIFVNKTLDGSKEAETPLYTIDELFNRFNEDKFPEGAEIQPATYKSSDEDIAKWDEETNIITGVNEGKAKITVKVKVVLPKREGDDDSKERSYTMKRKFKLIVKTRDLDPAGYYDGEWKLTTSTDDLEDGTRLVLVGTRVKEDKENNNNKEYTDYMMVENNAMMGGGKNGSKITFDADDTNKETIESETVIKKKGLEVVLEKDGDLWKLNVGKDENDTPLYLYATAKKSDEESNDMMEMFMSSTGLKVGTEADALAEAEQKEDEEDTDIIVSLKASISFTGNNATIKFEGISDDNDENDKKNNTIMLTSSFDMEEMMGMFGGNNSGGGNSSSSSSFDMGSFDMFMASFNTKKLGDEQAKEDEETHETKAPKCFMPRIYRFVPDETYNITIGSTEWKTIVSYKDVQVPENVEAYIVTKVTPEETQSVASLKPVQIKDGKQVLKGGEPYLLHYTSKADNYTMTLLTPNAPDELEAPKGNLLWKSDRKTSGEDATSTVYVLANKSLGVGFYKWIGGDLGAGRVYLTGKAHENPNTTNAHEFVGFFVDETGEATAIESIDDFKANVGPFYDLQGRRVDNPTKGIYIVNGKKVIVK